MYPSVPSPYDTFPLARAHVQGKSYSVDPIVDDYVGSSHADELIALNAESTLAAELTPHFVRQFASCEARARAELADVGTNVGRNVGAKQAVAAQVRWVVIDR